VTLQDEIPDDAAVFVDADAFGETVVYRPAAGGAYTIPAAVVRAEPAGRPEHRRARYRQARVWVRNSSDTSVGVASPSERGDPPDKVDVVLRVGEAAVTCAVTSVVSGDRGLWELEVTA